MSVALYMDHHVRRAITDGLRARGIDVLTAFEDGTADREDDDLLQRGSDLGEATWGHSTVRRPVRSY